MTKAELLKALEPFTDETFIAVRIKTADGAWFELPAFAAEYVPMHAYDNGPGDAYVALRTFP